MDDGFFVDWLAVELVPNAIHRCIMSHAGEARSRHFAHCLLETLVGILIAHSDMILRN